MCKENWLLRLIQVVINIGGVGYLYLYKLVRHDAYLYNIFSYNVNYSFTSLIILFFPITNL